MPAGGHRRPKAQTKVAQKRKRKNVAVLGPSAFGRFRILGRINSALSALSLQGWGVVVAPILFHLAC